MTLKRLIHIFMLLNIIILSACSSDELSPEKQIENVIEKMELAAEERSLSSFMDNVSDSYSDHQGNDHKAIARYVQITFIRNQNINIFSHTQSIEVTADTATAEISVAMGARGQDLSNEKGRLKADTMHFSVFLKLEKQQWLVKSVSWRQGW